MTRTRYTTFDKFVLGFSAFAGLMWSANGEHARAAECFSGGVLYALTLAGDDE